MWIDFKDIRFKAEDVKYISKTNLSRYGYNFYALEIRTKYTTIIKTYGLITSPGLKGCIRRDEDYKKLCKQLNLTSYNFNDII